MASERLDNATLRAIRDGDLSTLVLAGDVVGDDFKGLAREVLARRGMTCGTCAHWTTHRWCALGQMSGATSEDFGCTNWEAGR